MSDEFQNDVAKDVAQEHAKVEAEVAAVFEQGEQPKPPSRVDPAILHYVKTKYFQKLWPMRTACFRCGTESPVIFLPEGPLLFAELLDRKLPPGVVDIAPYAVREFAKHGWHYEPRRAYCPTCKGLGVPA